MESPAPVLQDGNKWQATASPLAPEFSQRIEHLTSIRHREQAQMREYARTKECLMLFLARALDDPAAQRCGHCANCVGKTVSLEIFSPADRAHAISFLRGASYEIELCKQWPKDAFKVYPFAGRIGPELSGEKGCVLCEWGDAGWGELVRAGKYRDGRFADELVSGLADMIRKWKPDPAPKWIVPVPSLKHSALMADCAARLASELKLQFRPALKKIRETAPQKQMQNRFQQARNVDGAFEVERWSGISDPIFLLDDKVDSTWTFTVLCALLRQAGSGPIYPVALALTRGTDET